MVYSKRLKPFYHIFLLREKWRLSSSAFNKKLCLGTSAWLNIISLWPQASTSQQLWDGILSMVADYFDYPKQFWSNKNKFSLGENYNFY